jgi:chemotaxis protein histidine kinase CheA
MNDIAIANNQATDPALDVPPIMVPEKFVAAVFDPFKRKLAAAKRAAAKAESYDITTGAGMGQAKELRASFRDIRTALENERKARKAPIIAAGKLLDTRAAELTAEIEPLESKYDREIKAEEQRKEAEKQAKIAAERARVEAIENRIAHIRGAASRLASADSAAITVELNTWTLLRLDPADYQEYLEDALTAVNTTIDQLTSLLATAEAREAEARRVAEERAELARLKAEQESREKAEREAAAERERLARAEAERIEAERRAAAEREADLQRQLAEMRAQLAAAQPAAKAAPVEELVQVPVVDEGAPVTLGVDLAAPGADQAVEMKMELSPVLPIPLPKRPDDAAIIDVVAKHFDVSAETAINWLACINFAAAYASLPVTA